MTTINVLDSIRRGNECSLAVLRPSTGVIPDATVTLISEQGQSLGRTLTNSLGVFILHAELGSFQLEAERIALQQINRLECGVVVFWTEAGWG